MTDSESLVEFLLQTEIGAARLEGAFAADPDLGRIWRAQAALTEAARSVAMEDVWIEEGDIALRAFEARAGASETARGAWLAGEILRVIQSPPDPLKDPEPAISRCLRAGMSGEVPATDMADIPDTRTITDRLRDTSSPLLAAIRAAAALRTRTFSAQPSAERLLFMSVDHAVRGGRAGREDLLGPGILEAGLDMTGRAAWILTPSIALTSRGFRTWSPNSPKGVRTLLEGLEREVSRGLGALPGLRRWRENALSSASGRHGKSRLRDLILLSMTRPLLTAPLVADLLSVTPRTGLNLLREAESCGALRLVTPRRTYRAWAPAPMADQIRSRAVARRDMRSAPGPERTAPTAGTDPAVFEPGMQPAKAGMTGSEEQALSELDAAMAAADEILARTGRDATGKRR